MHFNIDHGDFNTALDKPDGLMVMGFFIKVRLPSAMKFVPQSWEISYFFISPTVACSFFPKGL